MMLEGFAPVNAVGYSEQYVLILHGRCFVLLILTKRNIFQKIISGDFAVTPRAGVWIEIQNRIPVPYSVVSLPMRECELKFDGLWRWLASARHSPCGSAD